MKINIDEGLAKKSRVKLEDRIIAKLEELKFSLPPNFTFPDPIKTKPSKSLVKNREVGVY